VTGPPVRLVSNRLYLARAVQLGFTALDVIKPTVPIVCRDERRTYLWVPLGPDAALPTDDNALRICSDGAPAPAPQPPNERRKVSVTKPHTNGLPAGPVPDREGAPPREEGRPAGIGITDLIAEAQALKELMRDGYERASRLLAALKRHGKQSELLRTTLASLRQFQGLSG
jgi:hypothetical protein